MTIDNIGTPLKKVAKLHYSNSAEKDSQAFFKTAETFISI
jgi:hypothetical protein